MKVVASEAPATPAAPPSRTRICPICQIARFPLSTDPATAVLALVETLQVEPIEVSAVAVQGIATGKWISETVPGPWPPG